MTSKPPQEPKPREFWIKPDTELAYSDEQMRNFRKLKMENEFIHTIEHSAFQKSQDELKLAKELLKKASEALERLDCSCSISERLSGHRSECDIPEIQEALAELRAFQGKA